MKKIEEFDGVEYTLATITGGSAKSISFTEDDGTPLPNKEFNLRLVASSLEAGGHSDAMKVAESLPVFMGGVYGRFLQSAMKVNGLKSDKEEAKVGETVAEVSPAAESTGDSPTDV